LAHLLPQWLARTTEQTLTFHKTSMAMMTNMNVNPAEAPRRWLHGARIPCSSPTYIHTHIRIHNHLVSPSHQNAAQLDFTMIERLFDVVVVPLAALSSACANQLSSFHSTRALALN